MKDRCRSAFVHSLTAYSSDSAELLAVMDCHFDTQCSGPPSQSRKPDNERVLNVSSSLVSFSRGWLWSWGPQLGLLRDVTVFGSIGNLMKDSNVAFLLVLKHIPFDFVPLRYLITYLT